MKELHLPTSEYMWKAYDQSENFVRTLASEETPWTVPFLHALDSYSHFTMDHSIRVGFIAGNLVESQGLTSEEVEFLIRSGLLHDIGKIFLPNEILDSPNALDALKRSAMDNHPRIGFEVLMSSDLDVAKVIVAHHELQDLSYPRISSRGEETPESQNFKNLIALSDAIDAMLTPRPYKEALPHQYVAEYLSKRFDPALVEKAINAFDKLN